MSEIPNRSTLPSPALEPVLRVANLAVAFEGRFVFQGISFELRDRDTIVILGPNGAGKTVLLRALMGLVPYSGQVSWRAGTRLGYVPQRVPLNKELPITVADFFSLKRVPPVTTAALLKQVGIQDDATLEKPLGLLSSGQFQRILIAWALANDPDVLVLDEPTAGVDLGGQETIHTLIQRIKRERNLSIVLVTHDLNVVYSEATNVLCIGNRTSCYGPPTTALDPQVLQAIYGSEIKFYRHSHD